MTEVLTLSAEDYHADNISDTPTLSSSIAKMLLQQSPAHARAAHPKLNPDWKPQERKPYMDFGTAVHCMFLEDDDSKIRVIMANDWRKKEVQAERDDCWAKGLIPLLDKDMVRVEALVNALREQLPNVRTLPYLFTNGKVEQTVTWTESGVACRSRIDWLRDDRSAVDDLKTTSLSANPQKWSRQLFAMGYDIQAAFYLRAAKAADIQVLANEADDPYESLARTTPTVYRLAIIETEPPYALSVMQLGQAGIALANAKVDRALMLWKQCLESGNWPGYSQKVAYADPPAWAEEQFWASVDAGEQA